MKRSEIVRKISSEYKLYSELIIWLDVIEDGITRDHEVFKPIEHNCFQADGLRVNVVNVQDGEFFRMEHFSFEELDMEPEEFINIWKAKRSE